MKRSMTPRGERRERAEVDVQSLRTPLILSVTAHLIFFGVFVGLPHLSFERRSTSKVINVQLVGMTSPASDAAAPATPKSKEKPVEQTKAPEPKKTPEVKAEAVPVERPKVQPEEAVSIAPKPVKEKVSMKKKTYDAQKVMKSAVKKVEERVKDSNPDQVKQALDRIRQNLKEESSTAKNGTGKEGTGSGEQGRGASDLETIYQVNVGVEIQKNWAFSEQMARGEKGLYNLVAVKIMRNGEIKDIWFDRRSGNEYFDESTYKAIQKSNPLPPIPNGISGKYIELGFQFSPSGLQ